MRISVAPPQRVPDLLRFLREMGYAAEETDDGVVEVEDGTLEGALTLGWRLLIWSQVNGGDARIIGDDARRSLLPLIRPRVAAEEARAPS